MRTERPAWSLAIAGLLALASFGCASSSGSAPVTGSADDGRHVRVSRERVAAVVARWQAEESDPVASDRGRQIRAGIDASAGITVPFDASQSPRGLAELRPDLDAEQIAQLSLTGTYSAGPLPAGARVHLIDSGDEVEQLGEPDADDELVRYVQLDNQIYRAVWRDGAWVLLDPRPVRTSSGWRYRASSGARVWWTRDDRDCRTNLWRGHNRYRPDLDTARQQCGSCHDGRNSRRPTPAYGGSVPGSTPYHR